MYITLPYLYESVAVFYLFHIIIIVTNSTGHKGFCLITPLHVQKYPLNEYNYHKHLNLEINVTCL